jgi:hypothetical protein
MAHPPSRWAIIAVKMKPEHWITLANLLLTAIGLYVGPKLAVKRSLEQFQAQKVWERKDQAYTQVLSALLRFQHSFERLHAELEGGAPPPWEDSYKEQLDVAEWSLREMQCRYIISAIAQNALAEALSRNNAPLADIENSMALVIKSIAIVNQEAMRELNVRSTSPKELATNANLPA